MPYEQDDKHTATHICSQQESGEPRVMARGIHPAILAQGGRAPALKTLARRGTVPVELDPGSRAASPATLRVCGRRLSIFAPNEPGTSPRSALPAPRELQSATVTRPGYGRLWRPAGRFQQPSSDLQGYRRNV